MKKFIVLILMFIISSSIALAVNETLRHWTFDTDFIDESGYGAINQGTLNGTDCPFGACLDCERDESDNVDLNHTRLWGDYFSISFWAKIENPAAGMAVFGGRNAGVRNEISYHTDVGGWRVIGAKDFTQSSLYNNSTTGEWVHIAATNDNATLDGTVKLYFNGVLANTSIDNNFGWFVTGANYYLCDRGNPASPFDGQVDELWLFNYTLSAEDVLNLKLYNNLTSSPSPAETVEIAINSPPNWKISNQGLNVSYIPTSTEGYNMNCSLYIDDVFEWVDYNKSSTGTYYLNKTLTVENNYTYFINCTTHLGVYNVSTTQNYIYDTTSTIIDYIYPSPTNTTVSGINLTLNVTCVNTNLESLNITAYNDSALTQIISQVNHTNISDVEFLDNFTTFNFTGDGVKYIQSICADGVYETNKIVTYSYDITSPTDSGINNNATTPVIGDVVNFSITLADNYNLSSYIFSSNDTGSVVNDSPVFISDSSRLITVNKIVSQIRDNSVCAKFYYNDSVGLKSESSFTCYNTSNNIPYFNPSLVDQTGEVGTAFSYTLNCDDADSDTIIYLINTTELSINNLTGEITDTPTLDKILNVSVNCTDGLYVLNGSFTYTVTTTTQNYAFSFIRLVPLIVMLTMFLYIFRKIIKF